MFLTPPELPKRLIRLIYKLEEKKKRKTKAEMQLEEKLRKMVADLKMEIDKYADDFVQSVGQSRFNCIKLSKKNYQHKEKIKSSRAELEELKNCLETYEIDHLVGDAKFKQIKASANDLESKLSQNLVEYTKTLLLNIDYLFMFLNLPKEDVSGNVIDRNKVK